VRARREVIISGGAYGLPQILMCSGIGPGAHLQELGIPVLRDAPGIGENLQDHITSVLIYRSPGNRGALHVSAAGAFVRTRPDAELAGIELLFVVGIAEDHTRKPHLRHGYAPHVTLSRPQSVGHVRLASAEPRAMLLIDARDLSHPAGIRTLVEGRQLALDIMESNRFDLDRGQMIHSFRRDDPAQIEQQLRNTADTEYHPCGTCRMGPDTDPMAVADARLRVKGIAELRVTDASIMPRLTSDNTNAPSIMIGE
jgi:choline dehydrogenase